VRDYLDTADCTLTENLQKHSKICWGEETIQKDDDSKELRIAREEVMKARKLKSDGSITAMVLRIEGKGTVTCSHHQHTPKKTL